MSNELVAAGSCHHVICRWPRVSWDHTCWVSVYGGGELYVCTHATHMCSAVLWISLPMQFYLPTTSSPHVFTCYSVRGSDVLKRESDRRVTDRQLCHTSDVFASPFARLRPLPRPAIHRICSISSASLRLACRREAPAHKHTWQDERVTNWNRRYESIICRSTSNVWKAIDWLKIRRPSWLSQAIDRMATSRSNLLYARGRLVRHVSVLVTCAAMARQEVVRPPTFFTSCSQTGVTMATRHNTAATRSMKRNVKGLYLLITHLLHLLHNDLHMEYKAKRHTEVTWKQLSPKTGQFLVPVTN
jgi:hypothetical protein